MYRPFLKTPSILPEVVSITAVEVSPMAFLDLKVNCIIVAFTSIVKHYPFLDNLTRAILLAKILEKLNYDCTGCSGIVTPAY
jgi:hypothetical protein